MLPLKVHAAARSLSSQWIPVNETVQDKILSNLKKGCYNSDAGVLLSDLMSDAALFGHCFRRLNRLVRDGQIPAPPPFNLGGLIKNAGPARLIETLQIKPADISCHCLNDAKEPHAKALNHLLIAASAAEVLCSKANFPAGAGYAGAFLRQAGLLLIAWNYPHIFRQASNASQNGGSIDEHLLKFLGYSPRALALALAHDWGASEELIHSLGNENLLPEERSPQTRQLKTAAALLAKSCELGEVLAHINHPELYPQALDDWPEVKKKIEAALGPQGLSAIRERLTIYASNYVEAPAEIYARLMDFPADINPSVQKSAAYTEQPGTTHNKIPALLREKLTSLRALITPGKPKKENILMLTQEIAPLAGFRGGCIFMYDFESSSLIPRYRFGQCGLSIERISCSALFSTIHPVSEAFRGSRPVISHTPGWADENGFVAQAFGTIQKVGVFYLEIADKLKNSSAREVALLYLELRQALMACLGIT